MTDQVQITRLPLSLPCPVPILPGSDGETDRDGEPAPLEERTEACAVDAYWMLGGQITCDLHLRKACEHLGIDFDGLVEESGAEGTDRPWSERPRYEKDSAKLAAPWKGEDD